MLFAKLTLNVFDIADNNAQTIRAEAHYFEAFEQKKLSCYIFIIVLQQYIHFLVFIVDINNTILGSHWAPFFFS